LIAAESFVWDAAAYLFAAALGYLITVLFYRMDKAVKVLVSTGVPVLLFVVLPIADTYWMGGRIGKGLAWLINFVLGVNYGGPLFSALCLSCLAALTAILSWLAVRKTAAK
jgi:hypothetical protein